MFGGVLNTSLVSLWFSTSSKATIERRQSIAVRILFKLSSILQNCLWRSLKRALHRDNEFEKPLNKSSCPEVFYEKNLLKSFGKFKGQKSCVGVSFLIESPALRRATLLKKKLWFRCFPMNFMNSLRTPISTEQLWWILLKSYQHISCHWFLYIYTPCKHEKKLWSSNHFSRGCRKKLVTWNRLKNSYYQIKCYKRSYRRMIWSNFDLLFP